MWIMIPFTFLLVAVLAGLIYGVVRIVNGTGSWQLKLLKIAGGAAALVGLLYLAYPGVFRSYRMAF